MHKAVVCRASRFLDAASTRDFQVSPLCHLIGAISEIFDSHYEARTGVISLPESVQIVEDSLRHIYGLKAASLKNVEKYWSTKRKIVHVCELHTAADKVMHSLCTQGLRAWLIVAHYHLRDLKIETAEYICVTMNYTPYEAIVEVGKYVFEHGVGSYPQACGRED